MCSRRVDFISLALAGAASADDIDDYIDHWHAEPEGVSLQEYLGMSRDEYGLWLKSPDALGVILERRKLSQPQRSVAR